MKNRNIFELLVFLRLSIKEYWGKHLLIKSEQSPNKFENWIINLDRLISHLRTIGQISYPEKLILLYFIPLRERYYKGKLKVGIKFLNELLLTVIKEHYIIQFKGNPLLYLRCENCNNQLIAWDNIGHMFIDKNGYCVWKCVKCVDISHKIL